MRGKRGAGAALVFFAVIAAGAAVLAALLRQAPSFTARSHVFRLPAAFSALAFLFFFLVFVISWYGIGRLEERFFRRDLGSLLRENLVAYLPFTLSLLAPLLLCRYLTSGDLMLRLHLLCGAMAAGFLLVKLSQWYGRGPLKELLILFLVAFIAYHLAALCLVSAGLAYSGDEPYYLLTAHSLYQDRDINLARNYDDQDYFHFFPRELYPKLRLGAYARFGRKGTGYVYPINQPGISVLILPYYALSRLFHGRVLIYILKVSLSLWAVLLGLQVYLFALEYWGRKRTALLLWFLYSFTAPVLFYAVHLYPEAPVALFSLFIFRKLRLAGKLSPASCVLLGLLLGLFPWFGLKYVLILLALAAVGAWFLRREGAGAGRVLGFLAGPAASLVLFGLYVRELYGTVLPMAVYEGVLTPEKIRAFREMVLGIPLSLRIDSFLDYFLDQRDGLLLYSPWFFFILPGMVEAFRRAKRDLAALLIITLPYLLNYAFLSHRQGHSPQGRVLACISWTGMILVGHFLVHNRRRVYAVLFRAFSLWSLVAAALLLRHPSFLYQPTTHQFTFRGGELFVFLSNLHFYLPGLLPSFIKVDNRGYVPNYVWLAAAAAFALAYVAVSRRGREGMEGKPRFRVPAAVWVMSGSVLFYVWFVLFPRPVLLHPLHVAFPDGRKISFYDLGRHVKMDESEPGKFLVTKGDLSLDIHLTSWRKLEGAVIGFGSEEGRYSVRLRFFDETLFEGETDREMKSVSVSALPAYRFKNTHLYRLGLELENLSGTSTPDHPFILWFRPAR